MAEKWLIETTATLRMAAELDDFYWCKYNLYNKNN